ncbi:hypothetical protein [Moraxella lacunata]
MYFSFSSFMRFASGTKSNNNLFVFSLSSMTPFIAMSFIFCIT